MPNWKNEQRYLKRCRKETPIFIEVLYGAEPLPEYMWNAGTGGVDKYANYRLYDETELIGEVASKLDKFGWKLKMQSESYDQIVKMIENKTEVLASTPAIQPISNNDLTRIASGFGPRIDPIYLTPRMHWGMDFTAEIGTPIFATGKGTVEVAEYNKGGYGNRIIIDHGFNYKTMYAHLSKFHVTTGEEVVRGQVIGEVGNTGKSVGPHLHYEVIYKGSKVNPVNFFYNDLDADEYEKILDIAENNGQSLD